MRQLITKKVGPIRTNCYIFKTGIDFLVIDPGDCGHQIADMVEKYKSRNSKLDVFLTHGHADHICGVKDFCSRMKSARIFVSKDDLEFYNDPNLNRSYLAKQETSIKELNDRMVFLKDGEILEVGSDKLEVLAIPGHTPGSLGLFCRDTKQAFVGDTLFKGAVGTDDGPMGDHKLIIKSIKEKLLTLPDDTVIFPGHGRETTVGHEKMTNPYFR